MRFPLAAILLCAVSVEDLPPRDAGPYRAPDLVELQALEPTIKLDIRYATTNNLTGRAVYTEARAFLQRPAAEALVRAHRALKPTGLGLLIFDGYRPWRSRSFSGTSRPVDPRIRRRPGEGLEAQSRLRGRSSALRPGKPASRSRCRASTTRCRRGPTQITPAAPLRRGAARSFARRDAAGGFAAEPNEWWHFNYKDWHEIPHPGHPVHRDPAAACPVDGVR